MRKEYNDRWNAPLVNPPVTYGEYEQTRNAELETMRRFEEFVKECETCSCMAIGCQSGIGDDFDRNPECKIHA